jgi:hypothetical protein
LGSQTQPLKEVSMTPWLAIALGTNLLYWTVFVYLAVRHRPGAGAVALGIMHMLLAAAVSVAPFRSFVDPSYPGFRLGLLHFEHRAATLPSALLLLWALTSAFLLASGSYGRRLWIVAAGDALFAVNQLGDLARSGGDGDIQLGEHLTISGFQALLIMGILFVGGPAVSAWWSGRRARAG